MENNWLANGIAALRLAEIQGLTHGSNGSLQIELHEIAFPLALRWDIREQTLWLGPQPRGIGIALDGDPITDASARSELWDELRDLIRWLSAGGVALELWRGSAGDVTAFCWRIRRWNKWTSWRVGGSFWVRWRRPTQRVSWGDDTARVQWGPDQRAPWRGLRAKNDADAAEVPIDGVLDLHQYSPRDVAKLLRAYLDACEEREIRELRIIHGKGKGHLRRTVHAILKKDPRVKEFYLGGAGGGQWGATCVTLKPTSISSPKL